MKSIVALALLTLTGCGIDGLLGDPFYASATLVDPAEASVGQDADNDSASQVAGGDAAEDAGAEASGREAGHDAEAVEASIEAGRDAAEVAEGGPDAGAVCTPFPANLQLPTSAPCAAAVNAPADVYQMINSIPECSGFVTPPECRCQETYNCACLKAHDGCGTYAWVDCRQDPGTAPTPTCH